MFMYLFQDFSRCLVNPDRETLGRQKTTYVLLLTHLRSYPRGWWTIFRFDGSGTSLDEEVDFLLRHNPMILLQLYRHLERKQQFVFLKYTC